MLAGFAHGASDLLQSVFGKDMTPSRLMPKAASFLVAHRDQKKATDPPGLLL